jgi:hypothetical protein
MTRWLVFLGAYLGAFLLFWIVGTFPVRQSAVLAIVVAFIVNSLSSWVWNAFLNPLVVKPFNVNIKPNWKLLLTDRGLVKEGEWERVESDIARRPGYNVLLDGVTFTALHPNLFYYNDHHNFFTEMIIAEPIEEIRSLSLPDWVVTEAHRERLSGRSFALRFYVKRSQTGEFEIGLDGGEQSHIATLPAGVLWLFWGKQVSRGDRKKLDRALAQEGWASGYLERGTVYDGPVEIHHKYLIVRIGGI